MDRPFRLPTDCPRCENRGVINLDDDATLPCPLCNSWCVLCLADVPTFVTVTRLYHGCLIAGIRPTADGEVLFEGYAKAIRIERSRTFWYNGSLPRMARGTRARRWRVVWPSRARRTRR
jgi:hypothetical protein